MSSLPGGESPAVFRFGELTFDCTSHLLLRNGEEQHLSPKAQQLLRMLLENRPKAVSREVIYDALWPATFVCETNMASLVAELRRVLGDDARSAQYIRTVHGFGYAFAADVQTADSDRKPVAMLLCEGQRHPLYDGENSVGRSRDCVVVLTGGTVSRHHATITITENLIVLEDQASRNGTYLDGQKINRARVPRHGEITFGATPAAISRGISSTVPIYVPNARRHSSGSISTA
jgi:DNA-binding winged helix-turn-helix (wHTH) protein